MINHKLKINDSKTEFLIIRSQFSKVTLPNLTVTVGDTKISSSDKARNLGVIFDLFMNLESHINQVFRVAYMHLSNVRKICNNIMVTDKLLVNLYMNLFLLVFFKSNQIKIFISINNDDNNRYSTYKGNIVMCIIIHLHTFKYIFTHTYY